MSEICDDIALDVKYVAIPSTRKKTWRFRDMERKYGTILVLSLCMLLIIIAIIGAICVGTEDYSMCYDSVTDSYISPYDLQDWAEAMIIVGLLGIPFLAVIGVIISAFTVALVRSTEYIRYLRNK